MTIAERTTAVARGCAGSGQECIETCSLDKRHICIETVAKRKTSTNEYDVCAIMSIALSTDLSTYIDAHHAYDRRSNSRVRYM